MLRNVIQVAMNSINLKFINWNFQNFVLVLSACFYMFVSIYLFYYLFIYFQAGCLNNLLQKA